MRPSKAHRRVTVAVRKVSETTEIYIEGEEGGSENVVIVKDEDLTDVDEDIKGFWKMEGLRYRKEYIQDWG